MKRILITGGAGFIGSHLCERLLGVVCPDNYYTGHKDKMRHLHSNSRFEAIHHHITDPYNTEIDEIYNLGCPASPIYCQHDPIKTTQTSVLDAINTLTTVRENRARLLQASTSEALREGKFPKR